MSIPSIKAQNPSACIIHCRVSSAKQADEGESLSIQASICTKIAADRGWKLAHEPWQESFSGRKDHRPVFEQILQFLDSNPGVIRYYLFRSIDRFTRGGSLAYGQMKFELSKRGVEMVDSVGIIQPTKNSLEDLGFEYEWSKSSPSEIAEIVIAASANAEAKGILTRLISQEIRLTQRGYKMRRAVDGYVNTKVYVDRKKYTIQKPDPERAKFYIAMFTLRASGQFTDAEICERINAMGYRTRLLNKWSAGHSEIIGRMGDTPLTPKKLQKIVQRPIYCGVMVEKWTRWLPIKAAYDGLVSIELFNAANHGNIFIQDNNGKLEIQFNYLSKLIALKRSKNNPNFPFRHVVLCPHCKKALCGSSSRGKSGKTFPAYHCSRGHKYFGVRKAILDDAVEKFISGLRFSPAALATIRETILNRYHHRQGEILEATSEVGQNVAELEIRKTESIRAFKLATTDFMRMSLEEDAVSLSKQIERARAVRTTLEITERDIELFIADVKNLMEHPGELLKSPANALEQRALYSLVFDELPTCEEIISGTPKLAWIFYLCLDSESPKSPLVDLKRFHWNTIEATVLEWKRSRSILHPPTK